MGQPRMGLPRSSSDGSRGRWNQSLPANITWWDTPLVDVQHRVQQQLQAVELSPLQSPPLPPSFSPVGVPVQDATVQDSKLRGGKEPQSAAISGESGREGGQGEGLGGYGKTTAEESDVGEMSDDAPYRSEGGVEGGAAAWWSPPEDSGAEGPSRPIAEVRLLLRRLGSVC